MEIVKTDKGIIGTYYKSCMNEDAINAKGNTPLQPLLKKIDTVQDIPSLTTYLADLGRENNGGEKSPLLLL